LVENSLQVWQFAEMNEEYDGIIKKFGNIAGGSGVSDPAAISFLNHAKNISAFIQAIEEKRDFEIDGKEARKSVALILDMYDSAKNRKVIK
jgi:UDP-N-acetyl-2-amino-2-deoxyglucuronate dehydrogenase